MNRHFAFLRRLSFVLSILVALALLTPSVARADNIESFNFSGILTNSFNGSNSVTGSFTLDTTNGTITAFNFTTPLWQINIDSAGFGWFPEVLTHTPAISPNADFVNLVFSHQEDTLILLFETTLTSFSGNTFYTAPITVSGGTNKSGLNCQVECIVPFVSAFTSGSATPVSAIPEPSSMLLLGTGLAAIGGTIRPSWHGRTRASQLTRRPAGRLFYFKLNSAVPYGRCRIHS
jgi:hypothetical protein